MEHAEVQDAAARAVAVATGGFVDVCDPADLTGRPRMLVARRNPGQGAADRPATSARGVQEDSRTWETPPS